MNDIIAEAEFELAVSDSEKRPITVRVRQPAIDLELNNGDWRCDLEIVWADGKSRDFRLCGADSFGALRAALGFFDIEIKKLKALHGDRLTYLGRADLV